MTAVMMLFANLQFLEIHVAGKKACIEEPRSKTCRRAQVESLRGMRSLLRSKEPSKFYGWE